GILALIIADGDVVGLVTLAANGLASIVNYQHRLVAAADDVHELAAAAGILRTPVDISAVAATDVLEFGAVGNTYRAAAGITRRPTDGLVTAADDVLKLGASIGITPIPADVLVVAANDVLELGVAAGILREPSDITFVAATNDIHRKL
ncbi:hypothetical protein E2562_033836, partial [Oryza meyeriana var. granulata]